MRNITVLIIAALMMVTFLTSTALAETLKIGVVKFKVVLDDSDAGKQANKELNAFVNQKQATLAELAKPVGKLKKDLEDSALKLSADARKAKQDELDRMNKGLLKAKEDYEGEIQKKAQDLKNQLLKEIIDVIKVIFVADKYTLILDSANVPLFTSSVDITDDVIKKYNSDYKKKATK